ncbi:MAG: RNA methyltransferase [Chloroflexi bacterium]|nr:RNA methyltransferase [Chloroflexota bacterium]
MTAPLSDRAPDQAVLEGLISVTAALSAQSRPIHTIYIRDDKRDADALKLKRLADANGVPIERTPAATIDAHAGGSTHGGVIALAGPRRTVSLQALIAEAATPFVVMLDGVEDPFNFGQAIRAFYAAGADGLIVRPRSWLTAAGVVARASAGASELLPTAIAATTQQAADVYRAHGLQIAVATEQRAVSIFAADLTGPLCLIIGGEKRGITRSFAESADLRLKIPYGRRFAQSLGTTPAAAVLAFEILRQRGAAPPP